MINTAVAKKFHVLFWTQFDAVWAAIQAIGNPPVAFFVGKSPMKRLIFALIACILPSLAWAQGAIVQSGPAVPSDFACFLANGTVYDCGISSLNPVALPVIANAHLLGNSTGSSHAAQDTTLTSLIDQLGTAAQGDVLYRNGTVWVFLAPGTNGQYLQTQGAGANPQWATNAGTTYSAGTGLTLTSTTFSLTSPVTVALGGTGLTTYTSGGILAATGAGTITSSALLAQYQVVLGGGAGAVPATLGATGTSGQVLTSAGSSANPSWQTPTTGTVTSVATSSGLTGGTITSTGTISCVAAASSVKGCPTPDGTATHYLGGDGNWTAPAGLASVPLRGTTASIGGGSLGAGACVTGTATVTGVTSAMAVHASPVSAPQPDTSHGVSVVAYMSGSNTVTVVVCAIIASTTPNAVAYNVVANQ